jgi:hypothetical protein
MSNTSSSGVTSSFLLFLVFLVLKLTGYITWSWLWVTAPLWIPFAIVAGVFILVFPFALTSNFKRR